MFGCLVSFKPQANMDRDYREATSPRQIEGIFWGYNLNDLGDFTGFYKCVALSDFEDYGREGWNPKQIRIQSTSSVSRDTEIPVFYPLQARWRYINQTLPGIEGVPLPLNALPLGDRTANVTSEGTYDTGDYRTTGRGDGSAGSSLPPTGGEQTRAADDDGAAVSSSTPVPPKPPVLTKEQAEQMKELQMLSNMRQEQDKKMERIQKSYKKEGGTHVRKWTGTSRPTDCSKEEWILMGGPRQNKVKEDIQNGNYTGWDRKKYMQASMRDYTLEQLVKLHDDRFGKLRAPAAASVKQKLDRIRRYGSADSLRNDPCNKLIEDIQPSGC